jgi:hypothetical protein
MGMVSRNPSQLVGGRLIDSSCRYAMYCSAAQLHALDSGYLEPLGVGQGSEVPLQRVPQWPPRPQRPYDTEGRDWRSRPFPLSRPRDQSRHRYGQQQAHRHVSAAKSRYGQLSFPAGHATSSLIHGRCELLRGNVAVYEKSPGCPVSRQGRGDPLPKQNSYGAVFQAVIPADSVYESNPCQISLSMFQWSRGRSSS